MALNKEGLDYYVHFVGMTNDEKISDLRMNYGSVAIDVWIVLLDLIYGDKGYYIEYGDEKSKNRVIWKILGTIRGKYPPTPETVSEIIDGLVACELFSGDLYKSGILSSKRIQEQFYQATVERKAVEINLDYWLLDYEKMEKLSSRSSILRLFDNQTICGQNQPILNDNQPKIKQSKVKESKVKEKESKVENNTAETAADSLRSYGDYSHIKLTESQYKKLVKDFGSETVSFYISKIDKWCQLKGGKYSDYDLAIREWIAKDDEKNANTYDSGHSYDLEAYKALANNFGEEV